MTMKTLLLLALGSLLLAPCSSLAQSVTIRIVANDGATQTTNTFSVPGLRVNGLLSSWRYDSSAKTNATPPAAALTFGSYIVQELTDKADEWRNRGGLEAIKTFSANLGGPTNNIPPRLVEAWENLSQVQRTNAINYLKEVGQ